MSLWHIFLLQSLGLNIVCLPPSIYRWICVLHSTLLLRNTQFMEDHNLYWPSKLFAHFGNRCQWGRSFREFCGEVFRVISLLWFWFLSFCISFIALLLHCMVMHNSLYKLSWKWLSSITKMGEIERTCGAPMFGFGNWWQSLWTNGCLELYLKVLSIGFSWSPCVGFKEFMSWPRCY